MPPATSDSPRSPTPRSTAPTDAIVRVVAGCICGSDLWPYRGENPITPGHTIGHEASASSRRSAPTSRSFAPGDFVIVPFATATTPARTAAPACTSACDNLGFTESGQAEYARVTQAEGSLVKTDGMPDAALLPSLLTLSDVMATGWHAAVAAGVRPGGTAVVVGDGAVGLCGVLAAAELGAERIIAMSRHEPRQALAPRVRRHPHRRRARRGGRRARSWSSPTASAPTRCSSASAPTSR